jgi:formyltetrahydrofolate deformylase
MRNLIATAPKIQRARSRTMTGSARQVGTLLASGPHRDGIVGAMAQVLSHLGASILDSDHYSDSSAGMFLQRIQFDLSTMRAERQTLHSGLEEIGARLGMTWRVTYPDQRRRVAILASKQDHCLYDLLLRHRAGELTCEIAMIISNHPDAEPIASHFRVPFAYLPVTAETRARQEAAAAKLIDSAGVDLIVLARYMQILSPAFVARYPSRIINIHHSFLPAFVGANPYRQAHERGVKMIGATSHYVTEELDQGPIIEQATVRCAHRDSVEDLVRKGRDLEKNVLAAAVRYHLDDRVLVYAGKTVIFD